MRTVFVCLTAMCCCVIVTAMGCSQVSPQAKDLPVLEKRVRKLADEIPGTDLAPCDVTSDEEIAAFFGGVQDLEDLFPSFPGAF